MDEQTTATIYEPPVLVELGEFGEDTLGFGQNSPDNVAHQNTE
ncbi:MAG: lasso RiPP family leader peptide-containing protein [Pseudonocardiaceae bacterium]